ncbi:MAG TPA: ABC transporter substrate-binding protein [Casimicrobiaceae bacterium]|jgi:branched-chain amino acid transport system substrate-binding protein|nr:ABC transporter substrate-binding protein [Casimicrobiaceae bacterium]
MKRSLKGALAIAACGAAATLVTSGTALAQAAEQFFPVLVYRTGPYAPNGAPWANGYVDYLKLVNARDGGVNGMKLTFEECETGYATDRGVECYERLKGKGPSGGTLFQPLSTGITFALTDKSFIDHIPLITAGYGRADSVDGSVFGWNFPVGGTYWDAADILVQHVGKKLGGVDKLKGKKIALVYHDSPYGKEPIALLQERAKMHGFELILLPVTHPGVEQKATWLQIRQQRPDYVFLWGWGVMNSTSIKEAVATGYPRDKMYGVWWSGAEPDVVPAGDGAKGYNALVFLAPPGKGAVHADIVKYVYDKGQGTGKKEDIGEVLYNRGMVSAMFGVEAVRKAQEKFGKKPLTGEQVRWGLEHLTITPDTIKKLGMVGFMEPVKTSCENHEGAHAAMIQTWDGKKWNLVPNSRYESDMKIIGPMISASAAKYADEKKLTKRDCGKEDGAS